MTCIRRIPLTVSAALLALALTLPVTAQPGPGERERPRQRDGQNQRQGPNQGGPREMSEEDIQAVLDVLRDVRPEWAQRLEDALEGERSEIARAMIRRQHNRVRELIYLKANDPEHYQLRVQDIQLSFRSMRLTLAYHQALQEDNTQGAEQLHEELQTTLDEQLQNRLALRERELHALEARLERLREQYNQEQARLPEVLQERLAQFTNPENAERFREQFQHRLELDLDQGPRRHERREGREGRGGQGPGGNREGEGPRRRPHDDANSP